jgi:putative MATE family efflux protein
MTIISGEAFESESRQSFMKGQDLTQGVIWRQLLRYFFPILWGTFFQQLYNTADAIIVGNYVGKEALAAVGGSAAQIVNLLIGFFMGLASGATIVISQYFGAKNEAGLNKAIHNATLFSLAGGAFLTLIGITFTPLALRWMGTPEDTMAYSISYMRIIFSGTIFTLIYNMGGGILRAMGDSKRPLYYLIAACLTNIVLDLLFVAALGLGAAGAAIATVISQLLSCLLVVRALRRLPESYRLSLKSLRPDKMSLANILRLGLPTGVQASMYSVSNLLIQASINSLGTDTVAAWTASSKADSIFWMIMNAFGTTIVTFVGQNFGADQRERAKKGVKVCFAMTMGTAVVVMSILFLFAKYLLGIFTTDTNVIRIGQIIIMYTVPGYLTWVFVEIMSGAIRGAGDVFTSMLISVIGICVLRLVWLYAAVPLHHTIEMICLSYPITWGLTGLAYTIYYFKGKWESKAFLPH